MADSSKLYNATVCLHPLATVTTAHTVGSPTSATVEDHRRGESVQKTRSEPLIADKIRAIHRDHSYPKLSSFIPNSRTTGPVPTVILFDSLKVGKDPPLKSELSSSVEDSDKDGEDIDVVSVDVVPKLPYDDAKVRTAMLECENHVNLVKLISAKMEKR